MKTQKLKRRTQKGRGKLEKSKYYYITKTSYSNKYLGDFNLYSKQKLIEMLNDVGLNQVVPNLNEWWENFHKSVYDDVVNAFETVLDVYSEKSSEIMKLSYYGFRRFSLNYLLQAFINYQLNNDEVIKSDLTELITKTYNIINNEDIEIKKKYDAFKEFIMTIFNDKYFSINSLNFIEYFMDYTEHAHKETKLVQRPGTRFFDIVKVVLTPEQQLTNDFSKLFLEFRKKFDLYRTSHYDTLIQHFTMIKEIYNKEVTYPAIQAAVSNTDNEYEMVLKKGTKLYKGVTRDNKSRLYFSSDKDKLLSWFAFDPLTTFSYVITNEASAGGINAFCDVDGLGYVGEFEISQDVILLNLLHPNIIQHLTSLIGDDTAMLSVLNKILYIENGNLVRKSYEEEDRTFAKWLCSHGFNGYVSTTSATNLHPELCLCNPIEKVVPLTENDITDAAELFYFCDDTYKDINFITDFNQAYLNYE